MRKNAIVLASVLGLCAVSTLMKLKVKNNSTAENAVDENSGLDDIIKDLDLDEKKAKNKNKSQVKVNNSLISINIKLFSK
ncbi:hypothetical protein HMPREF1982_04252 [Clostridiales bacterium oral taxon 876 str. F0540]|nr:hypothetical protein HMPREF1982_04252 [Clostridiales bacterium oral taxon 876 str. F0540]